MASKPLSNDEAKDLMRQLGMVEKSTSAEERAAKKAEASSDSSVARLLSELYRSDVGRWPPYVTRG